MNTAEHFREKLKDCDIRLIPMYEEALRRATLFPTLSVQSIMLDMLMEWDGEILD